MSSIKLSHFFIICMLILTGCAGGPTVIVSPLSPLDTPEHHYASGMDFLEKAKIERAKNEFSRAIELGPKFSPAYTGMGIVHSLNSNFEDAHKAINTAKKLAKTNEEKVLVQIGYIRLYTNSEEKGWIGKTKKAFRKGKEIDPNNPDLYYFTGLAYKKADDYDKAVANFKKVINLDKRHVNKADKEWKDIQNQLRAEPGTTLGKKISRIEKITRADIATLFIQELNLGIIFTEKGIPVKETSNLALKTPTDYENHSLRSDIEKILSYEVAGFEMFSIGVFAPDKEITRANFAIMIEDILARVTREHNLDTKHFGCASPFKDVNNGNYAFNAIMTVTTRGIMSANMYGYFSKDDPVSGTKALLVLRKLKEKLR